MDCNQILNQALLKQTIPNLDSPLSLLIAGAYIKSEAYPNVLFRIRSLTEHTKIQVEEINCGLLLEKTKRGDRIRTVRNPVRIIICHIFTFVRLMSHRKRKNIYIPYPAIFFQFLISLLPSRFKPEFIAIDAFVSIYDTVVMDRKLINKDSRLAKYLLYIECRAFMSADFVIVDTSCNRDYYSRLFNLSQDRFIPIPLAIDEVIFQPTSYTAHNNNCHVLFVGTMVPLHGIQTIISAIRLLSGQRGISFLIIGDGQDYSVVSEYSSTNPENFKWIGNWCHSKNLYEEISEADICLGIFGSTPKTQRVCPYKIYQRPFVKW